MIFKKLILQVLSIVLFVSSSPLYIASCYAENSKSRKVNVSHEKKDEVKNRDCKAGYIREPRFGVVEILLFPAVLIAMLWAALNIFADTYGGERPKSNSEEPKNKKKDEQKT